MDEDTILTAMKWTREHLSSLLDPKDYRDEDGGKKYLLLRTEQVRQNGKLVLRAYAFSSKLDVVVPATVGPFILRLPAQDERTNESCSTK